MISVLVLLIDLEATVSPVGLVSLLLHFNQDLYDYIYFLLLAQFMIHVKHTRTEWFLHQSITVLLMSANTDVLYY
jgi:hypothetical protein